MRLLSSVKRSGYLVSLFFRKKLCVCKVLVLHLVLLTIGSVKTTHGTTVYQSQ